MRTRLLGLTAVVVLAVLGATGAAAQSAVPAVDAQTCVAHRGTVEYDSASGLWICVNPDGPYDGESIN
ncbi:hypothetical protein ACFVHW_27170 [Streptomyces sp. NPDC127110]|uniref:hypothetical protein n=1 Tax=Streptomyces sp. NPDC127110 TaxID=3345362 RepID=UPI0036349E3D